MEQGTPTTATPGVPGQNAAQPNGEMPIPNGEMPKPEGAAPTKQEMYELIVNGQPRKYTLDQVLSKARMGEAAHEKFESASKMSRENQEMKDGMKKDFIRTALNMGMPKEQIREQFEKWYHEEFIVPETMSAEERRAVDAEKELARMREERDTEKKSEEQKQMEILDRHTRQQVQQEIISVLENVQLPKTRFTAARTAYWMKQCNSAGVQGPEAIELVRHHVMEEAQGITNSMLENATPDQAIQFLGPKVIDLVRRYDLGQLKSKFGGAQVGGDMNSNGTVVHKRGERKTMADVDNYFNELRRKR